MTRTIQTAAELDALPFPNAVTFPGYGDWHKIRDGRWLCDDGDVLTSGGLALVANGELVMAGDPSAPVVPVVSDAAVEAAARAIHAEGWTCEAHEPEGLDECEQCATSTPRLARAALSAALPFLGATAAVAEDVEALRAIESDGMWEVSLRFPSESGDWRRDLVASAPSVTREDVETITIPRPHVPHGPAHLSRDAADADYLRKAARDLEGHYKPFGSNLRATIVALIRDAADAITPRTDR